MSYSSTFRISGEKHVLATEWNGEGYTLSIALETEVGQRTQFVRIPLNDFDLGDLLMFSSYLNAFISSLDPQEMYEMNMYQDEEGDGPETELL